MSDGRDVTSGYSLLAPVPAGRAGLAGTAEDASARVRDGLGRLRRAAPRALFPLLLVLGVVPIWLVAHLPTQDGANHVESVLALLELPRSALLQHYYVANWGPQPNWLTQLILMALLQVTSPRVAEKLVLSGYALALPLAFRLALPRTRRGAWAALGIFPFVHSYPFHMGFWNFSYSVVLFFVAFGLWHRSRGRLSARAAAGLALVWAVLFVAHSVSTAAALAAMTATLAWRAGLALRRSRRRPARRARVLRGWLRRGVASYAAALPAVALMAVFLLRQPRPMSFRPPLLDYLKYFGTLYGLVSFDRREIALGALVALTVAGAVLAALVRRGWRARPVDGLLAAALLATALYFATPDATADGAQLMDRLMLYPWFLALLWLGWAAVPVRTVRRAALALAVVFVAGTALRVAKYRQLDGWLAEYHSAAQALPRGATLLPMNLSPWGPREGVWIYGRKPLSHRVAPFTHAAGWIAVERDGVDLDNSQATTKHAPVRFHGGRDPFRVLPTAPYGMESEPPCVDLARYAATGGRIDYVLLSGDAVAAGRERCGAMLLMELQAGWEPVFTSQPRGFVQLWRPKAR